MSTRGAIGRMTPDGAVFNSHHWDSYPTGLGASLWQAYHGHFGKDMDRMLRFLLDEHPAGWSTINSCDFSKPAGYVNPFGHRDATSSDEGPVCYCHGDRSETGSLFPLSEAASFGTEWAYLFLPETRRMHVLSSYHQDGVKMIGMFGMGDAEAKWGVVADVDLDGPEPNWEAME